MLTGLCSCAVPQQLLPRLLSAGQFKCPHCRTTQGLPEGLGTQQEAQLLPADAQRVTHQPLPILSLQELHLRRPQNCGGRGDIICMLLNALATLLRLETFHKIFMLVAKGGQHDVRVEILLPGAQGYNDHYDKLTDGHEAGIDPGEMAARGITSGVQGRGELSGRQM